MYKSLASQPKSAAAIESPYFSIYGPLRVCVFLPHVRPGYFCMPAKFLGLKVTLKVDRKARFSASLLSCLFCDLAMSFAAAFYPRASQKYTCAVVLKEDLIDMEKTSKKAERDRKSRKSEQSHHNLEKKKLLISLMIFRRLKTVLMSK